MRTIRGTVLYGPATYGSKIGEDPRIERPTDAVIRMAATPLAPTIRRLQVDIRLLGENPGAVWFYLDDVCAGNYAGQHLSEVPACLAVEKSSTKRRSLAG